MLFLITIIICLVVNFISNSYLKGLKMCVCHTQINENVEKQKQKPSFNSTAFNWTENKIILLYHTNTELQCLESDPERRLQMR